MPVGGPIQASEPYKRGRADVLTGNKIEGSAEVDVAAGEKQSAALRPVNELAGYLRGLASGIENAWWDVANGKHTHVRVTWSIQVEEL